MSGPGESPGPMCSPLRYQLPPSERIGFGTSLESCSVTTDSGLLPTIIATTGLELNSEQMAAELVAELVSCEYRLNGTLVRIETEKDDTFRLDTDHGPYLVKIAPAAEDARIVNLQSAAMLHLERTSPHIPAQRLIRGVRHQLETPVSDQHGRTRVLRVLSYREGALLHDVGASAEQFRSVGASLARLDEALADFRHPLESRLLIWDLSNFMHVRPLVDYVENRDDQELAYGIFDRFAQQVLPVFTDLETQTIHGDFSPFNVVVDPAKPEFISAIIDFGDVVRSPILFELSVIAANLIGVDAEDPWASAAEVVRGYREVHSMETEAVELLAVTAPARLLLRALVYGWRCAVDPRAREYAKSHSAPDWRRLRTALAVDHHVIRSTLARTQGAVPPIS